MPDLETEEEAILNKFKEDEINKTFEDKENRLNKLNNNVKKIKDYKFHKAFKDKENRFNKLNNNVKKIKIVLRKIIIK